MPVLKRKIDSFLLNWKDTPNHKPLIVSGARQIGKTKSVHDFGESNYASLVEINFILQKEFLDIFDDGYDVDTIIKNISMKDPTLTFIPGNTLLFFDEIQKCPNAATSLKSFRLDGRYDVICSGSLMGINYEEIESNSVGQKENFSMYSLDFEEFLWAKGYRDEQIADLYEHMRTITPLTNSTMNAMLETFREYMVVGGMPAIVSQFIENNNYSGILQMQQQILLDYEEDITKYAKGLDKAKVLNVYRHIPVFLAQENKKFRITKVAKGARSREYVGVNDWLEKSGIVNICYCMDQPCLPLKGNYVPENYKLYYGDTGLLIGSLDEEAQQDLRFNRNFNAYKGAIYENVICETLVKQGYPTYFYRSEKGDVEMDFFVRDANSLIPLEVKANDSATASLNKLINSEKYEDIRYGIKLANKNIGFNGKFYTFPYFLGFLLKRFLQELSFGEQG